MNVHAPQPQHAANAKAAKAAKSSEKKSFLHRAWPHALTAVIALMLGAGAMSAGTAPSDQAQSGQSRTTQSQDAHSEQAEAEPEAEPEVITETETIEVEVEVPDPTCRKVAEELHAILSGAVDDALIPYSEVTQTLIDQLMYGADVDTINGLTAKIETVTSKTAGLTGRINDIAPDYTECTS